MIVTYTILVPVVYGVGWVQKLLKKKLLTFVFHSLSGCGPNKTGWWVIHVQRVTIKSRVAGSDGMLRTIPTTIQRIVLFLPQILADSCFYYK
jgi:hypothetical protein